MLIQRAAKPLGLLPELYSVYVTFELRLFNAVREQCEMEQLGVQAAGVLQEGRCRNPARRPQANGPSSAAGAKRKRGRGRGRK